METEGMWMAREPVKGVEQKEKGGGLNCLVVGTSLKGDGKDAVRLRAAAGVSSFVVFVGAGISRDIQTR